MPNYVRKGPYTNGVTALQANFPNGVEDAFVQPSGGSELGSYYLTGSSYVSSASVGAWVPSISRTASPISVSIGTTIQGPSGCNSPSTDHLNSSGFHVFTTSTSVRPDVNVGGNWTINY